MYITYNIRVLNKLSAQFYRAPTDSNGGDQAILERIGNNIMDNQK